MKTSKIILIGPVFIVLVSSCQKQPSADFTVSETEVLTDEKIFLTNTSLEAESYYWDFGDGQNSIDENTFHSFANEGEYSVKLTAYSKSQKKEDIKVVTIFVEKAKDTGSFIDVRDGKTYNTVKIGHQWWMAENLAYKPSSGTYWAYNNDTTYVPVYGYLYDYNTGIASCPDGWHMPEDDEWIELFMYLGGEFAGGKLKEAGNVHWNYPNEGVTNSSGFTALPAGLWCTYCLEFESLGDYAFFWSASNGGSSTGAYYWFLENTSTYIDHSGDTRDFGFCVRCIKD